MANGAFIVLGIETQQAMGIIPLQACHDSFRRNRFGQIVGWGSVVGEQWNSSKEDQCDRGKKVK